MTLLAFALFFATLAIATAEWRVWATLAGLSLLQWCSASLFGTGDIWSPHYFVRGILVTGAAAMLLRIAKAHNSSLAIYQFLLLVSTLVLYLALAIDIKAAPYTLYYRYEDYAHAILALELLGALGGIAAALWSVFVDSRRDCHTRVGFGKDVERK